MKYHYSAADLDRGCEHEPGNYFEFLRRPALNAGIYMLTAGGHDPQEPHTEDEIYFVLAGQAHIVIGDDKFVVGAGDLIYVPAYVEHRFYDIAEDLKLLVFFSSAPVQRP